MKATRFGIEIEMTNLSRAMAADVVAKVISGTVRHVGGSYDTYQVTAPDGRVWKLVSDSSIHIEQRPGCGYHDCSVELVSPVLKYDPDMPVLQEIARALREAGAVTNPSCGIHIHVDGADHNARSIRNWVNMVASKNDLLYTALGVLPARMSYCQKLDDSLVVACKKADSLKALEDAWYGVYHAGGRSRAEHYHSSRYHFLNLHSFFSAGGHHTIEIRGFNSTLHAGKIRAYVSLVLAMNDACLKQRSVSAVRPQTENEKFAMRTWLCRLGLSGEEFAAVREHLLANLTGCAAWRFGAPAAR